MGFGPTKKSCGTGYGRCQQKLAQLRKDTIEYIRPWMPSWYFGDDFGNYEWQKHGTCQTKLDDDGYFRKAVTALITVNDSAAGQYLRANIGGTISRRVFLEKINQEAGATRRLIMCSCSVPGRHSMNTNAVARILLPGRGWVRCWLKRSTSGQGEAAKECSRDRIAIERGGR